MKIVLSLLVLFGSFSVHAAELTCKMVNGDKGDVRISQKIDIEITESKLSVSGSIWGERKTEEGARYKKDSRGQATYFGFSSIQDDNMDIRAYADKSLLKGKPGILSFWLLGDGEDSVDLRYDFECK